MTSAIALMVLVSLLTAVGQLFMKRAALRKGNLAQRVFSLPFVLACLFFLLCPPLSMVAVWRLPFALWTSLTALNYIAVLALARLFLHERLDAHKTLGAALIVVGLLVMIFL